MRFLMSLAVCVAVTASGDGAAASTVQGNVTLGYNAPAPSPTGFHPSSTTGLNINLGVAKVTGVTFSADFSLATVGDFTAQHKSNISINHPDQLAAPGMATISFQQSPLANSFTETSPGVQIGAGASVALDPLIGDNFSIPVNVLDVDLFIETTKSNGGALGSTLTDSDTASAARVAVGIAVPLVDVGTVGAAPTITGTSTVNVGSSISALLAYHNESMPSVMGTVAVSLAGASNVMVDLPEPGIYDFVLSGYALGGTLTSKSVPGINFDLTVLNNVVAQKFLGITSAQQTTTKNFTYTPNGSSQNLGFSIEVLAVPEPSTLLLAGCGVLALAVCGARRRFA